MSNIMDLVRKKKQALQAQSGRREKTHKPQPGKNKYRILPGWRGEEDPTFYQDFGQHFVKNAAGELKAVYICAEKTFAKPCAVCDAIAEGMTGADSDDIINALKEAKSKGRVLMNALHRDGEDPNSPVILDLTPTTFEKVLELMEEYGNITDLDEGVDIVITRSGKGLNTEYTVMPAAKSSPVDKAVLANLHNLDEYVQQEFEEGKNKALAVVSGVAGTLPPSAQPRALQSSSDAAFTDEEEAFGGPETAEPTTVEAEPESAEPVVKSAAMDAGGDGMSDDELDDLLNELEVG